MLLSTNITYVYTKNYDQLSTKSICYFPSNRGLLVPNGVPLKQGDVLKQPLLADTLTNISLYGSDYFYNSPFTSDMVNELQQDYGSILTVEDFHNYTVQVRDILTSQFSGLQVLGASPPSSGAVVALVLNILEGKAPPDTSHGCCGELSS